MCSNNSTNPYIEVKSSYYRTAAKFIFNGTTELGTPVKIKVAYQVQQSSKPGSIRIYDYTNGNVIAEKTHLNSTSENIVDLGSLSNLPSSQAVFEVQMKTTSSSKWIRASSLSMEF